MKKLLLCLCLLLSFPITSIKAEDLTPNAGASILIDSDSGKVLYAKNETQKMYPASTTKIMTMILLFEAISKNQLKFDDILTTSSYAASMGGSQVYLEQGEKISVYDLFKSIAIASANDACVVIAEKIAGSHERFVQMMNDKAKQLNLVNTHFVNSTGLHDDNHYTCAKDLAMMAKYLIEIGKDQLFEVTRMYDSYIREQENQKFWLVNTNKLLKQYEGNDGLKTGFTKQAGYCLVSTALRNDFRLIGVVLKENLPKIRNNEMMALLDYGFNLYEKQTLFKQNEIITEFNVLNSPIKSASATSLKSISYLQNKNQPEDMTYDVHITENTAPIKKGDIIGYLHLYSKSEDYGKYYLTVLEDIPSLSFIEYLNYCFEKML